jgi:hypothetical protein
VWYSWDAASIAVVFGLPANRRAARAASTVRWIGIIEGYCVLVTVMRLTIIDRDESVSFIAPGHGSKVLAAACSQRPADLAGLLDAAESYDADLIRYVRDGLATFDEHNTPDRYDAIHARLSADPPSRTPPFRVVDDVTRAASVQPAGAGLILYNLPARRIIQVQNSYSTILRRDRGRIRAAGRPTRRLYRYELPGDWSLVP